MEAIINGLNPNATKLNRQLAVKDITNPHKKHAKLEAIIAYKVDAKDFTKSQSSLKLNY